MMHTHQNLTVRVLTLRSAVQRQERMASIISEAKGLNGVPFEFAYAVSHEEVGLSYDDKSAYLKKGRTLSKAELSCFASHVKIISDWLDSGEKGVLLVLEDDIYIDPWFDFIDLARLAQNADIDYLRLYSRAWAPSRPISYCARNQIVRFQWSPGGTQAYMLTALGAKRIIKAVKASCAIVRPIDDFLDRYWQIGNPVFGFFPSPILEHNMQTTIHLPEQIEERQKKAGCTKAWSFGCRSNERGSFGGRTRSVGASNL